MQAKDYKVAALVWAKMKGFPPWPAKIAQPPNRKSSKPKKPQHYVYFFGTHNFAWILDEHIVPHSEEMLASSKNYKKKSTSMQSAIQEIEKMSVKVEKKGKLIPKEEDVSNVMFPQPDITVEKGKIPKKRVSKKNIKIEKKMPKKRKASDMLPNDSENAQVKEVADEDYSLLIANVPPNNGCPNVAIIPPYNEDSKVNLYSSFINQPVTNGPVTPSLNIGNSSKSAKKEVLKATDQKIGFLGLGMMGCQLVKKLLDSGYSVTIWNRTMIRECDHLVNAGARKAQTAADVIRMSDITFSCVSDPEASKAIVFLKNGVLEGFDGLCTSNKGYVELTSIDPATSQDLAEAISGKGGRYLEAPLCGSRQNAKEGNLVVLAAGDRGLFSEFVDCFSSFATNAVYLSCDVGTASKMNLTLSMFMGTTYAALGEAMALAEKCEISRSFLLEVLGVGPLSCPLILNKGHAMATNNYAVKTPLAHQQKDMTLALSLGNNSEQPLPISVAASEIYKLAKRHYVDHDVSAIHLCSKL